MNEKQIARNALRASKKRYTYDQLVAQTGINRKELCKMIKQDDYEPPNWVWLKLGVQVYELAPVCAVHGKACTLDCVHEKAVPKEAQVILPKKPRPPKKRGKRTEICENTAAADIRDRLYKVTGKRWICLDE